MRLEGMTTLVTGAGRGIGRAIAERFAREGAQVALASRTATELEETAETIRRQGGAVLAVPADVTDAAAVDGLLRKTEAALGPVDVLVNNAARFHAIGPVWEVDPEDWWQDVTVNVLGVFRCCRAVLPGMLARGRGRIINLIGGGTGGPFAYGSGYGTSKAAVMRFTECLAAELRATGVAVFALGPGLVRTAMTEYQVETDAGKRWLPMIADLFEQQKDVPPTLAAAMAAELASGRFDSLAGRAFNAGEDADAIEQQAQAIVREDLRTLRLR